MNKLKHLHFLKTTKSYEDKIEYSEKYFNRNQLFKFATLCAESVLHIYENKYPNDKAPRNCIDKLKSIKDFYNINESDRKELKELANAAANAASAANAAAYAAASAAYATAYATAAAANDAAYWTIESQESDEAKEKQKSKHVLFMLKVMENI